MRHSLLGLRVPYVIGSVSLLRLPFFVGILTPLIGGCSTAAITRMAQSSSPPRPVPATLSGIPNQPDVVTVVPFYTKEHATAEEKNLVAIPATVDGWHGIFLLDTGAPSFYLNRTFLQPSPTGGVDTVTDTTRLPDHADETNPRTWETVHVTMRIGTLQADFAEPTLPASTPRHPNAFLNHHWANFTWFFAPVLGNLSLSVLEPFETIVDYTHRQVVFIRLDPAGHRLAEVPAYTPRWSTSLFDITKDMVAHRDVNHEVMFGSSLGTRIGLGIAVRPDDTLDTRTAANNTKWMMLDTGAFGSTWLILGYPFLRSLGAIGFNQRTHQFILYHTEGV